MSDVEQIRRNAEKDAAWGDDGGDDDNDYPYHSSPGQYPDDNADIACSPAYPPADNGNSPGNNYDDLPLGGSAGMGRRLRRSVASSLTDIPQHQYKAESLLLLDPHEVTEGSKPVKKGKTFKVPRLKRQVEIADESKAVQKTSPLWNFDALLSTTGPVTDMVHKQLSTILRKKTQSKKMKALRERRGQPLFDPMDDGNFLYNNPLDGLDNHNRAKESEENGLGRVDAMWGADAFDDDNDYDAGGYDGKMRSQTLSIFLLGLS
jgi:hypothetical protein